MNEDYLTYTAEKADDGVKLDNILKSRMNLSRRLITDLKKAKNIFINNKHVFTNALVKTGDVVSVNIYKEESQDIEPENIPVDVVFEDADLLIVNKMPGIVVHPTKGHPNGTLSNGIIYYLRQKGDKSIVRLVNRLDRDTSGLVIIAKNKFTHQALAKELDSNEISKKYICIAHGNFTQKSGTIDLPIGRPSRETIKREVMTSGYKAVTHYKVIEDLDEASLVELRLETGKTHQIRVHMSYIGHPIFGDTLYGTADDSRFINRQALHAYMLEFNHPRYGSRVRLKTEIPDDMKSLLLKLKV
ncbi:MAG: RluA family pseudouridine synthase [Clostridiales bacterium]|nr:RluA family pseudouridine synthase [Clostridiales bacterium]